MCMHVSEGKFMVIIVRSMMAGRRGAGAVSKSIHLTSKMEEERETQCLRVSIAAVKQHEQSKYWRKGLFLLTFQQHCS